MTRGRALLVQFSAQRDGSSFSGLLTADALRADGWSVAVAFASEGPMEEAYRAAGFETLLAPHKNWLRTAHPLRAMRNGARETQAGRAIARRHDAPDLVYLNTGASLAGAVAARAWGVPCVWHVRELLNDAGGELVVPKGGVPVVRGVFSKMADVLVANSATVAQNVLGPALGARAEVLFNAVGPRFFEDRRSPAEAREALNLPPGGLLLGVPGTLRPMKGHPFFLEAAAPLLERRPDLHVAITGTGAPDYEAQIQGDVKARGLEGRVVFTGSISDMPAFYRACDVACIPSKSEPFGRTVIEAFASGTPVVATAVGGIRETVQPDATGLLVPYGDARALTDALGRLLADGPLRERLAQAARADAEARFAESAYKARTAATVRRAARG
jgi:glycosyltransferase involved in cell wall biosynthesis